MRKTSRASTARRAGFFAAAVALAGCGGDKVRETEWRYFEKEVADVADTYDFSLYVGRAFQASKYDPENPYMRLPTICIALHREQDGEEWMRIVASSTATQHYGRDAFDRADLWDKRCKGAPATDSLGRPIEIVKAFKAR